MTAMRPEHAGSRSVQLPGWVTSAGVVGANTIGTGTFQNPDNPGVAGPNVVLNGLPGVSFAQTGPGSASYDGGLLNNLGSGGYLEWTFTTPKNGWGGTFNMTTNNGLSFAANDKNLGWIDVTTVAANQSLSGFFGFTSADAFNGVRVSGLPSLASSYKMTDVSVAAVPEPETYAMMFAGLAVLGLFAKRRKDKA